MHAACRIWRGDGAGPGAVALPEPWPPIAAAYTEEDAAGAVILMIAAAHQGKAGSYAAACPRREGHAATTQCSNNGGAIGPAVQVEKEAAHGGAVRCVWGLGV